MPPSPPLSSPPRNWLDDADPDEPQRKYLRSLINGEIEEEKAPEKGIVDMDNSMQAEGTVSSDVPPSDKSMHDAWSAMDAENAFMRALINGDDTDSEPFGQLEAPSVPRFLVPEPRPPRSLHTQPGDATKPTVGPKPVDPQRPFQHSGLMQDIGGVDGFMKVMRGTHRFPD